MILRKIILRKKPTNNLLKENVIMDTYQDILFNEKLLKEFSPIPLNYSLNEVKNFIKLSEVIWLVPIISELWYEELLDQVANNTLTDANATALVEAIYPYLGFCVAYEALPSMWLHISEVSITKGHSENSDAATQKEMAFYQEHIRKQVEARKDYLIKWLCNRQDTFPLFDPSCVCDCGCGCTNNSCSCEPNGKLHLPNRNQHLFSTFKKNTDIK